MLPGSAGRVAYGESSVGLPVIKTIAEFPGFTNQRKLKFTERGQTVAVQWSLHPDVLLVTRKEDGGTNLYGYNVADETYKILMPQGASLRAIAHRSGRHPDEVLIAVVADDEPDTRYLKVNFLDGRGVEPFQIPPFDHVFFDGDFNPVVAIRARDDFGHDLYRLVDEEWEVFRILTADYANIDANPVRGIKRVLGVSADGSTMFVVDNAGRDKSALMAIGLKSPDETVLAEDPEADILANVVLHPGTGDPLVAYAHFAELRAYGLTPEAKKVLDQARAQFGVPVHVVNVSSDLSTWVLRPADGKPTRDYVYTPAKDTFDSLPEKFSKMEGHPLGSRKGHVIETRDGFRLPVHVYLPPGADADGDGLPDEPLPTILYVHGGPSNITPWDHWDGRNVRCQQLLANRGYAAIRVEFRGTGGLGSRVMEAGYAEWGGKSLDDIEDIANWAVEVGIAQPEKMGIWGFSYGGHATLAALTLKPDLFACGVSWSGVASLEARVKMHEDTQYAELMAQEAGDPSTPDGLQRLKAQSPLEHVESMKAPALLFHGGRDHLPPEDHSGAFAERAKDSGKEVTYVLYPKETHSFNQSANWISLLAITEHFFKKHLGGRAELYGKDLKKGRAFKVEVGVERIPELRGTLGL
jgi:dipeptidyl aminopeptidase/acylaminoacyl peptidase